jgi:hypothetical protein
MALSFSVMSMAGRTAPTVVSDGKPVLAVLEELAGVGVADVLGRGNDLAAAVAAFGAEVDDPVGRLDDFEIVLDDHHRIALVDQFVQHFQQLGDIVEMQAGRRFVENVERAAGRALGQLLCQLDPLRLAARERGGLLADLDVAQADALSACSLSRTAGTAAKNSTPSSTVMSSTSAIDLPLKVTSSVSRL